MQSSIGAAEYCSPKLGRGCVIRRARDATWPRHSLRNPHGRRSISAL